NTLRNGVYQLCTSGWIWSIDVESDSTNSALLGQEVAASMRGLLGSGARRVSTHQRIMAGQRPPGRGSSLRDYPGGQALPLLQQGYFQHVHELVFVQLHVDSCRPRQDQFVGDDVSVDVGGRAGAALKVEECVIVRGRGSARGRVRT